MFNFTLLLVLVTAISGILYLIEIFYYAKRRKRRERAVLKAGGAGISHLKPRLPMFMDYIRSLFPLLLAVLIIRSFIIQPFHVPSGSLEPTIKPGDFIAVNQFAYGLRLPITHTKIFPMGEPQRGDLAVFRWPSNTHIDFVKRVIGLPGDHLQYKDKTLYVNDQIAGLIPKGKAYDIEPHADIPVYRFQENLLGVKHDILLRSKGGEGKDFDIIVPPDMYFVMGDNRDDSDDSRTWGFVPEKDLVGKAFGVWMSWDSQRNRVRWQRIGTVIR